MQKQVIEWNEQEDGDVLQYARGLLDESGIP